MRSHDPFRDLQELRVSYYGVKTKAGKNMLVDPTMISYRRPGAGVKAKGEDSYAGRRGRMLIRYHRECRRLWLHITLPPAKARKPLRKKKPL